MPGQSVDPFAGGKLTIEPATFKAAREMLNKPPGHPANVAIHEKVYYAAMVVDHRQRALEAAAQGRPIPKDFICPTCRVPMDQNFIKNCFECLPCGRGVTPDALVRMFQSNPVPFTAAPAKNTMWFPSYASSLSTKHVAPYEPRLITPIPAGLNPDDLVEKIRADKVEQDEPVVMWRAWRLLPDPAAAGTEVFDDSLEPGLRYLQSINGVCWPHKEPLRADHHGQLGKHGEDGCPDWHCQCGIYAVKTLVQAQKWGQVTVEGDGPMQVLGKVVCWGRVHVFETGAKTQLAYPKVLYISETMAKARGQNPERVANELAAQYGIDVEVDDGMYDLKLSHT